MGIYPRRRSRPSIDGSLASVCPFVVSAITLQRMTPGSLSLVQGMTLQYPETGVELTLQDSGAKRGLGAPLEGVYFFYFFMQ